MLDLTLLECLCLEFKGWESKVWAAFGSALKDCKELDCCAMIVGLLELRLNGNRVLIFTIRELDLLLGAASLWEDCEGSCSRDASTTPKEGVCDTFPTAATGTAPDSEARMRADCSFCSLLHALRASLGRKVLLDGGGTTMDCKAIR
jgi:hypothetical protein